MIEGLRIGNGFCVVDELKLWNQMLDNYEIKGDFYEIYDQFKMRSQLEAEKMRRDAGDVNCSRKRKRKNPGKMIGGASFLKDVGSVVERVYEEYLDMVRSVGEQGKMHVQKDNEVAMDAAARAIASRTVEEESTVAVPSDGLTTSTIPRKFRNDSDQDIVKTTPDSVQYLIPKRATYKIGKVDQELKQMQLEQDVKYSTILMDPPWQNRSVKRKRTYDCFDKEEMLDYPVDSLLTEDCLVIIWMTNNESVHDFVPELLDSWDLVRIATWHWLKVTKNDKPVVDFGSHHKVPFESFVIAARTDSPIIEDVRKAVKDNFCLISVPSSIHSKKPPLVAVLKQLLPDLSLFSADNEHLELFSRYLVPGVVSIGAEVLKFQQIDLNFKGKGV